MKVLFIQNFLQPYYGIMYISAVLKRAGHQVDVHIMDKKDNVVDIVKKAAPDIVAFSSVTAMYPIEIKQANMIKKNRDVIVVFGGVHPTVHPDIINEKSIDYICRGEGEYAFLELVNALENKGDTTKIKNIWAKKRTTIFKNDMRPLREDLDELPYPDRDLYFSKYIYLRNQPSKGFFIGRGCPYICTFCINKTYMKLYQGQGKYVRRHSIKRIIEEVKHVKKNYGLDHIYFNDDTFTLNKEWLFAFLKEYKKLNIPFTCGSRASLVTEEMVQKLKEAHCYCIEIGVETGNQEFRNRLLKKNQNNEDYIKAAALLHKYNIKLKTSNMMCLPGETVELALETMKFNSKLGASFMNCSLLQPYPQLEITTFAQENGYLDPDFDFNTLASVSYFKTPIRIKNKKQIMNLQKFFYIGVWFPFTIPLIKQLSKLPPNPIYDGLFKACYVYSYARYHQLNIYNVLKLAFHSRKLM